jgi:site-specific recombinase XerD
VVDGEIQWQSNKEQITSPPPSTSSFYRYKVTTGRLSVKTKVAYTYHINEFLAYYKITDLAPLKEYTPRTIKQMVKDYVLYLMDVRKVSGRRDDRRLSRKSIDLHVSAIAHFFYTERDDEYEIDWKKVRDEIPPDENIRQDRAYSIEEIKKMSSACYRTRDKVIIHLLTSTGMRIGAVHTLKIGNLSFKQTKQGKIYRIEVYSGSSDSYHCYCNVETAEVIDSYLNERTDASEVLRNDSPLIRNLWNSLTVKNAKKISDNMIKHIVSRIVKVSGIQKSFQFTGEAKRGKGFRKFYKTQAESSGMKPINVELTHGHSIGVSSHYYRPQESQVLEDYMGYAADALTIIKRRDKRT